MLISIRLLIAPIHYYGGYYIAATAILLLTCIYLSWQRKWLDFAGYLLIFGVLALVVSRAYAAGGSDSPVLIITITLPTIAMFILGTGAALVTTAATVVAVMFFLILRVAGVGFSPMLVQGQSLGVIQSSVIIFVILVTSWIAWLYAKENEKLQTELREQTHRDHLTGIANRRAFDEALETEILRAVRQKETLILFMVDIDNFKKYNDQYGHHAGDECLIKVASIIRSCLRRPGDLVARYGGEELAVILPHTELPNGQSLAETMRHAVMGLHIAHEGSEYGVVTITIGVSATDQEGVVTSGDVLLRADNALYQGKEAGRNRVVVG